MKQFMLVGLQRFRRGILLLEIPLLVKWDCVQPQWLTRHSPSE